MRTIQLSSPLSTSLDLFDVTSDRFLSDPIHLSLTSPPPIFLPPSLLSHAHPVLHSLQRKRVHRRHMEYCECLDNLHVGGADAVDTICKPSPSPLWCPCKIRYLC